MLPFIVAAAASILSNQQKQQQERQNLYLDQLERNASRLGGNTDMAHLITGEHNIDLQGADYGQALGLVGKLGGDGESSGADQNPDGVFGPTSYAHDAGGVQYNDPVKLGGDGDTDQLGGPSDGDADNGLSALLQGWKKDDPQNDDDFALLGVKRRRL